MLREQELAVLWRVLEAARKRVRRGELLAGATVIAAEQLIVERERELADEVDGARSPQPVTRRTRARGVRPSFARRGPI
jgi:hypothetical protein